MYIPQAFRVDDEERLHAFIRQHGFGVLFSSTPMGPYATHLPFVMDTSEQGLVLLSHMAKANPHWQDIDQTEVLVVFQGPHQLIQAEWYEEPNVVPTWNYVAVHATGTARLMSSRDALRALLEKTMASYEPQSEIPKRLNEPVFDHLMDAIVGFEIIDVKLEGKWKLSQNHSPERRKKVIQHLIEQGDPQSVAIATLMTEPVHRQG